LTTTLAYNVKRLMSLLGVAGMMEAIRACAFLSALQRVFGAITLLIRPVSPKTLYCSLSTLKRCTTCIGGYSYLAKAYF
jgi:transposase